MFVSISRCVNTAVRSWSGEHSNSKITCSASSSSSPPSNVRDQTGRRGTSDAILANRYKFKVLLTHDPPLSYVKHLIGGARV